MHFQRPARVPTMIVALAIVSLMLGSCCPPKAKPVEAGNPPMQVVIDPVEDWNPPKTQHTFIVTVYDAAGNPVPNVQVHWVLARTGDAVGDIVTYDDQALDERDAFMDFTTRTDNLYAVSYTNEDAVELHAGNRWDPNPEVRARNFTVGKGQTWLTITSPVEGDTHVWAYVPAIENAHCHKVFAVKHWVPMPELMITKECPPQVVINSEFEYKITVKNVGDAPTMEPVMLHDMLPDGVVIVDGTTFPMDLGVMNADDEKVVTFRVQAQTPGDKLNRSQATAGNLDVAADCLTRVLDFGITLVKECGGVYTIGQDVPMTVTVSNPKTAGLTNVVVSDQVPAGLEFVSADAAVGMASYDAGGNMITWKGFDLAPGASATMRLLFKATAKGMPMNAATAVANVVGADAQVEATDDCQVEVRGLPDLAIEKICDPTEVALGDTVTFRITVWNPGNEPAANVNVADLCPAGLEPMGATTWTIPNLPPCDKAGGKTFTLQARANQAGRFTNVASASAGGLAEVRDSCDVVVTPPTLTIRKECQAVNPALPDDIAILNRMDKATHTITVTNGNVRAGNVMVVDTIPVDSSGRERIRYISSNPAGTYDATTHRITWNLGTMEAGQTATLEVTFEGRTVGPAINEASVTASGFPGAKDDCRLYILGSPAFQETVLDVLNGNPDADNFIVNKPFYYVATVQNEGDADLKIDITFQLSSELALESTPLGFIPSLTSTAQPSGANVLSVTDQGGNKYKIAGFNLGPRETKWVKIPVRGTQPTAVNAAKIELEINWQLWFEGRLFPRKGQLIDGETTVIDPE